MKKLLFIIFILVIVVSTSSCQTSRRGVQFYSGDKNTTVVEDQMYLTNQKKTEYEIKLRRLQSQRERILSSVKNEQTSEIRRLENENRRLKHQLDNLQNNPQRTTGDDLLNQIDEILKEISSNEEKLEILYQSDSYPKSAQNLDYQISQIERLLFNLQINEDEMLVQMNQKDGLDYFSGNVRNGIEAANAYMLMKWAQDDNGQVKIVNNQTDNNLQALIVNEWSKGVTAVIRHSSGFQLPDIPVQANSKVIINLPFPGEYICYFKRGYNRGNTIIKNVNPRLLIYYEGESFAFILTQRSW